MTTIVLDNPLHALLKFIVKMGIFELLIFSYFVTLHADQLQIKVGGFSLRLNNAIALLLGIFFVIQNRKRLFYFNRAVLISIVMITFSLTLSFILSPYKKRCFFFLGWYGMTILLYFLIPYLLICYYEHKKVFSLYLLSFVVVGVYALCQLLFSLFGLNDPFASQRIWGLIVRPNAFAYEPSYYALYMTPFIVMVNYHFLANPDQPFDFFQKLTYPKVFGINFLFFLSTSTSTVFAFIVFCFCLLFIAKVRQRLWKYGVTFASLFVFLGLLSPFLMKTFFLKFFYHDLMSHASFFERWVGIENAWQVFKNHPYVGVGLGSYPTYLYNAFQTGDLSFTFFHPQLAYTDAPNVLKLMEPMNVFTEILASLGIVGCTAFITLIALFIRKAQEVKKYDLLLSVLVMVAVLQINQGLFRTYVWVHLGLAFALLEKRREEQLLRLE